MGSRQRQILLATFDGRAIESVQIDEERITLRAAGFELGADVLAELVVFDWLMARPESNDLVLRPFK
jgi:hypothetical protein